MVYVYILKSKKTNKYYIGCSENVVARIISHNRGIVISTKQERPWELIHLETYPNLKVARKRERQIKKWKSRAAIERLLKHKI